MLNPRPLQDITVNEPTNEHTITYTKTLTFPYRGPKKQATKNETLKFTTTNIMKPETIEGKDKMKIREKN